MPSMIPFLSAAVLGGAFWGNHLAGRSNLGTAGFSLLGVLFLLGILFFGRRAL